MSDKPIEYLIAHIGHTAKHYEHVCWWKPDSRGYTICTDKAGRYSAEEAIVICERQDSSCIAVPVDAAKLLARSTPYFRIEDGSLRRLYDAETVSPVPNTRECWNALIQKKSYPVSFKHEKPTPIGAKARAVYVDAIQRGEA